METTIASKLAEHGVLGIVTLICLYAIWKLSNDLTAERAGRREDAQKHAETLREIQDKRLADAGAYTAKLLEINTVVHATVDKIANVAEHISKRRRTDA
jgi:hypothetical protein